MKTEEFYLYKTNLWGNYLIRRQETKYGIEVTVSRKLTETSFEFDKYQTPFLLNLNK